MRTSTGAPGGRRRPAEEHAVGGEEHRREHDQDARAPPSSDARRRRPPPHSRAAVQEGLEEHRRRLRRRRSSSVRRRDVVGIRRAIDVVKRSSSVRIGIRHRLRSRAMNASVSTAWGPRSPRSVSGRPTTTTSGASRSMIAHSSAIPLLARRPSPRRRAAARACRSDRSPRRPCARCRSRARAPSPAHARAGCARRRAPRRGGSRPCRRRAPSPAARRLRRRRSAPIALITAAASRPSSTASGVMLATSCTRSPSRAPSTTADGPSAPREAVGELEQRVAEDALGRLDGEHLEAPAVGRAGGQRGQVGAAAVAAPAARARGLLELAHALAAAPRRPRAAARAACAARPRPP